MIVGVQKISVVMCTYNGALYIEEQLDSIVSQTYPIYELIIQDDGSSDNTIEIIDRFRLQYPYIRLFQNERTLGVNLNFFSAMERATGDFIAISDQDDLWESDKLETQINLIGDKLLCSGFSVPFSTDPSVKFSYDSRVPNYSLARLMFVSPLPGHSLLFRRTLLSMIPHSSDIVSLFVYDVILGITAAVQNSIVFADKLLVNSRRHPSAATYTKPSTYNRSLKNIIRIFIRTYRLSKELAPLMVERIQNVSYFLRLFPDQNKTIQDTLRLADVFISGSYLQRVCICVKMRNQLSYSKDQNRIFTFLRAVYFPIYCFEYIKRFSSTENKKE